MRLQTTALVWIALTAMTGVAGQWLGYPTEHLWRWLAGLFIVGLLIEYSSSQALRVRMAVIPVGQAYLGRATQWRLQARNLSRKPIRVRFAPLSPGALTGDVPETHLTLKSDEQNELTFSQTPIELGEHPWPDQPIEVGGLFHLASWIRHVPLANNEAQAPGDTGKRFSTTVEPDYLEQASRRVALDQQGPRSTNRSNIGGQEFRSLRAYSPGDAPASIDWKSTARSGTLRVRETETEQQLTLYFVLDCGRGSALHAGNMALMNHATNVIARMAEHANQAGDRFGLMTFADQPLTQLRAGRGATQLRKLRNVLTQSSPMNAVSNPLTAVTTLATLLPQRSLILMFTSLDDSEAAGQLARATMLLRPQHLPMIVSIEDMNVHAAGRLQDTDEEGVYVGIAAREHLLTAAKTRAQIERLGAIVIEAAPEKIETMAFARLRRLRLNYSV